MLYNVDSRDIKLLLFNTFNVHLASLLFWSFSRLGLVHKKLCR